MFISKKLGVETDITFMSFVIGEFTITLLVVLLFLLIRRKRQLKII